MALSLQARERHSRHIPPSPPHHCQSERVSAAVPKCSRVQCAGFAFLIINTCNLNFRSYGISHLIKRHPVYSATTTSPFYMSPEADDAGKSTSSSASSDVYALGLIMFECTTAGWHPWVRLPTGEFAANPMWRPPPSATNTGSACNLPEPNIPLPLLILMGRCVSDDPGQRPQLSEARALIEGWRQQLMRSVAC